VQGGTRIGALVAGAAGVLLLLSLLLNWFHVESVSYDLRDVLGAEEGSFGGIDPENSVVTLDEEGLDRTLISIAEEQDEDLDAGAWEALVPIGRWLILLTGLAGLGLGVAFLAGVKLSRGVNLAVLTLSTITFLFVLYRVISPPEIITAVGGLIPEGAELDFEVTRRFGLWLGLLASAGVAVGTFLTFPAPQAQARRPTSRARAQREGPGEASRPSARRAAARRERPSR
jgi:hypothetical protein